MKKCRIHNVPLKQGGCFQNVYEWCPKCEEADTEPLTDPGFVTPTSPLPIQIDRKWPTTKLSYLRFYFFTQPSVDDLRGKYFYEGPYSTAAFVLHVPRGLCIPHPTENTWAILDPSSAQIGWQTLP